MWIVKRLLTGDALSWSFVVSKGRVFIAGETESKGRSVLGV